MSLSFPPYRLAGQKVLACLIIRLALAETFCLNCGRGLVYFRVLPFLDFRRLSTEFIRMITSAVLSSSD